MPRIAKSLHVAVALGSFITVTAGRADGVEPPPRPEAVRERVELQAEIERVRAELDEYQNGPADGYARPEYALAHERLWTLLERLTVAVLDQHPEASSDDLVASLVDVAGNDAWFSATVERLGAGGAVVVAFDAELLGGTFFVAAPTAPAPVRHSVRWSIRPLSEASFADGNELGRWAYDVPGFHDGPLGARVLPLPSTPGGRPRFLIDAIAHAEIGMTVPAQVSVWEWTGTEAVAEFMEEYPTTYDLHDVEREGTLLRIATKEDTEIAYSCGSCNEPKGVWTLRLEPEGVRDLGHEFDEPLLKPALDLLSRIARGDDTGAVATPEVTQRLTEWVRQLRADAEEGQSADAQQSDDPYRGLRSMLESWKASGTGARRTLDLETDDWHVVLTFENRAGAELAVAVDLPESSPSTEEP